METLVIEGTLAEIRRRLHELPCPDDSRVRVTVEEPVATRRTRNGITLLPVRNAERVLTTVFVRDLLEAE